MFSGNKRIIQLSVNHIFFKNNKSAQKARVQSAEIPRGVRHISGIPAGEHDEEEEEDGSAVVDAVSNFFMVPLFASRGIRKLLFLPSHRS